MLRADREVFNEKFAEARRRRPDLDGGALLVFLRASADAVVSAAAEVAAGREREVAHAAYDAALTLIGEKLAGPGGRLPVIDEAWQRLLPSVAHLVADQPVRVIGSLTNAVFHLAGTPGARPGEWIDLLVRAAPSLSSVADLLTAGQVAAWRSGLAHLRVGALAAGDGLEPRIAAALLGAPRAEWHALRDRLMRDVWWHPAESEEARPRVARVVGGFRGFGGPFAGPPRVAALDGMLAVSAGGDRWILSADAFGATLSGSIRRCAGRKARPCA